jgi:pSer/pThr/pTyr-binding forkhead associated (FHA) protein
MALRLDIEEDGKRRAVRFTQPELTIGRGPDNVVVINDPRSSRHHIKISRTPQGLLLEDLESRNGTLLNGSAVKKGFVKPGDEFRIGNTRFQLAEEEGAVDSPGSGPSGPAELVGSAALSSDGDDILEDEPPSRGEGADHNNLASTVSMKLDRGSTVSRRASVPSLSTAPAMVSSQRGPSAVNTAPGRASPAGAEAYLEGLEGEHSGEKIPLRKVPFILGRGNECDFTLRDKRASGRHARILRDASGYVIEDLGSTNGTSVNKKPVKRALLFPGAVVQIGNSSFRAQVPAVRGAPGAETSAAAAASGAGTLAGGTLAGEDFVKFDVEKFLARDHAQHPLAVLAVVCILAILGYFTVDVTRRLVERQVADPVQESNRISQNWSFEDVPKEVARAGTGRVPGWRLAEGDQGRMEVTPDHAQLPGARALRLSSSSDEGLCRATSDGDIPLGSDRRFHLEGYVLNQGAFAAGLLVEWLRVGSPGLVEVGRTYSETARQDGEAIDVDVVAAAPASSSHARVSCLVVGSGTATFDRISFSTDAASSSSSEPPGGLAAKKGKEKRNSAGGADNDGAKDEGKGQSRERVFQAGPDEDPVLVTFEKDGVFSIVKKRKQLAPALWAGLAPERDPHGFGPRIAGVRSDSWESNPCLVEGEVPDEKEKRWVTLETTAGTSGGDVVLHWRAASGAANGAAVNGTEGQLASGLCLYLEVREGIAPVQVYGVSEGAARDNGPAAAPDPKEKQAQAEAGAPLSPVREMTLGERDERVSLSFTEPVKLSSRRHPQDPGRSIWIAEELPRSTTPELPRSTTPELPRSTTPELPRSTTPELPRSTTPGAPAGIEVRIAHGSRQEAKAAQAHAFLAEEEFRAGRAGAALEMLLKLPRLFPEQKAEIQRAQERIETWKKEANEALTRLAGEVAELRRTPTPVIYELLLAQAAQLRDRYAGAAESAQAEKILEEVRQFWAGLLSKKKEEERRGIYEKAKEYFQKEQLALAELYFRWVRDADPQGEMGRNAEHTLKLIEGRRKRDLNILLQQTGP